MKPFTEHDGQVTRLPTRSGQELRLVKDPIDAQGIIAQVYGVKGGLHGTVRVDTSDLRQALLLAGVGTPKTETQEQATKNLVEMLVQHMDPDAVACVVFSLGRSDDPDALAFRDAIGEATRWIWDDADRDQATRTLAKLNNG